MPAEPAGYVYVAGTCDTKAEELAYVKALIAAAGVPARLVDLSTRTGAAAVADVSASAVAQHHPQGAAAVFVADRGVAVAAMAAAFEAYLRGRNDVAGVIGLGGSGGAALVAPAMRALPVGVPKLIVSTLASGNVAPFVGPADIMMLYPVTDLAGLNRISRLVLGNAAHAIAGMVARPPADTADSKPAIALTIFGVTTPCVTAIVAALRDEHDCLVFHATGTGGQSMEKLIDSRLVTGVIDITTTEIADHLFGGILSAGEDRLGAIARSGVPYVGSCGALDMVNFGPRASVPERYRQRLLYAHSPQVTLLRTTAAENAELGAWIAHKLNACGGPVRFLIPEQGVSALDAPGKPFHDPAADAALFAALEAAFVPTPDRRLIRLPLHINDPAFAAQAVAEFRAIALT